MWVFFYIFIYNLNNRSTMKKVPSGSMILCEDDIVRVYDEKGNMVYNDSLDYCPYKNDFNEHGRWNSNDGNYDLLNGYKLVVI